MTIRAGVIGHPIGHSLSPAIHRAWLYAAGIDGSYEPILSPLDEFPETVADLRGHGLVGLNVTIPFKEQALALADQASERAKLAGAANLLRFEHGEIIADNTDGAGLLLALAGQAPSFSPDQAVVTLLGAGGAARGAAAALLTAGAGEIRLVNRTASKSEDLAHELGGLVRAFTWDEIDEALAGAGLLINATSLGLAGGLPLDLDLTPLPAESPVMDMVYRPLETPLLAQARASGRPAVDGLAMLIGQAAPSFEAFYGAPPPGIDIRKVALGGDAVIVLGLTGSIGMGKSTTSQMFQDEGVPVYDADAEVHRLYAKGGAAVPVVEAAFPGVTRDGAVDRAALSAKVVGDEPSMRLLEEIVHPLVGESRAGFFEQARRAGADLVVLDIPLLFETGGDGRVDKVVVVSAPADIQRARVLERSGMTPAKFEAILARQVPDADKRARADFIVDTSAGMDAARAQVRQVIAALRAP